MLQARQLAVERGGHLLLEKIDLQLQPYQVMGVLGPNGAGKSTLLGALAGDLPAVEGEVLLDGRPLTQWPQRRRAQRMAVLLQHSTLAFAFSVEHVVGFGRLPHAQGRVEDDRIVRQALALADAGHLYGQDYLSLSGGEKQRVHLARVFCQAWPGDKERILLLDEPTSMLDPLHQHTILQAVRDFAQRGAAVMVIVHDLNLAARYCDHLVLLKAGRVHLQGAPENVLQTEPLREVFELDVLIQSHPERGYPLIIVR